MPDSADVSPRLLEDETLPEIVYSVADPEWESIAAADEAALDDSTEAGGSRLEIPDLCEGSVTETEAVIEADPEWRLLADAAEASAVEDTIAVEDTGTEPAETNIEADHLEQEEVIEAVPEWKRLEEKEATIEDAVKEIADAIGVCKIPQPGEISIAEAAESVAEADQEPAECVAEADQEPAEVAAEADQEPAEDVPEWKVLADADEAALANSLGIFFTSLFSLFFLLLIVILGNLCRNMNWHFASAHNHILQP